MRPSIGSTFRMDYNRLLRRLEQTIPFPVDPKEFYYSLFPEVFRGVFELGQELGPSAISMAVQHRNVQTVFRRGLVAPIYLGVSKHDDMYMRMSFAQRMPIPLADTSGDSHSALGVLIVPLSNPHWGEVADWHGRASALDDKLRVCQDAFEALDDNMDVIQCWHEFISATGRKVRKKKPPKAMVDTLNHRVPPEAREAINELLATAVMLPDIRPPHVWVGLNETRGGE